MIAAISPCCMVKSIPLKIPCFFYPLVSNIFSIFSCLQALFDSYTLYSLSVQHSYGLIFPIPPIPGSIAPIAAMKTRNGIAAYTILPLIRKRKPAAPIERSMTLGDSAPDNVRLQFPLKQPKSL